MEPGPTRSRSYTLTCHSPIAAARRVNTDRIDVSYQVSVNLTHSGDSQRHANRDSLMPLALGDAMAAAIALRDDFTAQDLRRLARRTRDAGHARRLWRWRRFTMVALAVMQPGLAPSACKPFATGRCGSMPGDRMGSSTAWLQASHRS